VFFIVLRVASDAAAVHESGDLAGWVAFAEYRKRSINGIIH